MNIDALRSAPVGYAVNVGGADWVKAEFGLWLAVGEEWAGAGEGQSAAVLSWLARCYENGERWFIRDEAGNILAGPLDEMPTLDECALVGGGPGRRALGSTGWD